MESRGRRLGDGVGDNSESAVGGGRGRGRRPAAGDIDGRSMPPPGPPLNTVRRNSNNVIEFRSVASRFDVPRQNPFGRGRGPMYPLNLVRLGPLSLYPEVGQEPPRQRGVGRGFLTFEDAWNQREERERRRSPGVIQYVDLESEGPTHGRGPSQAFPNLPGENRDFGRSRPLDIREQRPSRPVEAAEDVMGLGPAGIRMVQVRVDRPLGTVDARPLPGGMGMAMGDVKNMFACPYNPSHIVGGGKLAQHIADCRKAAPADVRNKFAICELNYCHHVLKTIVHEHNKVCPDYAAFSSGAYDLSDEFYVKRDIDVAVFDLGEDGEENEMNERVEDFPEDRDFG